MTLNGRCALIASCSNLLLLRYWPLIARTIAAPVFGAGVLAGTLITISDFAWRGYALAIGWTCLAFYVGLRFPSWRVVGASALIYGGVSVALLPQQSVAASSLLGFAIHCLYALTKVRCATIGCCNFYAYGVFGKGTLARRLNLSRLEIAASLAFASICVFALRESHLQPTWLLAGVVGHGCIRSISWRLRHSPLAGAGGWPRGDELLMCAIVIQGLLALRS